MIFWESDHTERVGGDRPLPNLLTDWGKEVLEMRRFLLLHTLKATSPILAWKIWKITVFSDLIENTPRFIAKRVAFASKHKISGRRNPCVCYNSKIKKAENHCWRFAAFALGQMSEKSATAVPALVSSEECKCPNFDSLD